MVAATRNNAAPKVCRRAGAFQVRGAEKTMSASIRRATPLDLPAMVDLLLQDAAQRSARNPALWKIAADARAKIEAGIALDHAQTVWLLAETAGRLVGITHAMIVTP